MIRAFLIVLIAATACSRVRTASRVYDEAHGVVVDPDRAPWTDQELTQEIASLEVRRGNWSSEHVIRLKGSEKPHVHERHDVTVTLLRGRVDLHVGEDVRLMRPGDVVTIPHGLKHWAQNKVMGGASVAYAVFSPAYDGKDATPVGPR